MQRFTFHALLIATSLILTGADWTQFRGPNATSLSSGSKLPLRWSDKENLAWKAPLPGRGASSPIVVKDRVFVTCSDGVKQDRLLVLCFEAATGKRLWKREFWATGRTSTHPSSSVAAPTPASDGQRIFAFYSSNDLACLDLNGNLVWYRGLSFDFPKAGNDVGMSSSPVVVEGVVVVQVENQGDSFAAGIDAASGETRWRLARNQRANWASPIVLPGRRGEKSLVLLQSPNTGLSAHDPRTGETLWTYETVCSGIPSPTVVDDGIVVSSKGLTKLRLSEPSSAPEFAWDASRLRPGSASPVAYKGRVFTINAGVLNCGRLEDGESLWKLRLEGKYWATPVVAGDYMYFINEEGGAKVVKVDGEEGEVVGQGQFEGPIQGSPAVSGNALYVRSDKFLWRISAP